MMRKIPRNGTVPSIAPVRSLAAERHSGSPGIRVVIAHLCPVLVNMLLRDGGVLKLCAAILADPDAAAVADAIVRFGFTADGRYVLSALQAAPFGLLWLLARLLLLLLLLPATAIVVRR